MTIFPQPTWFPPVSTSADLPKPKQVSASTSAYLPPHPAIGDYCYVEDDDSVWVFSGQWDRLNKPTKGHTILRYLGWSEDEIQMNKELLEKELKGSDERNISSKLESWTSIGQFGLHRTPKQVGKPFQNRFRRLKGDGDQPLPPLAA